MLGLAVGAGVLVTALASGPVHWVADQIVGEMAGPEDLAIRQPLDGPPRLLISAYDRRQKLPGAIWSLSLDSDPVEASDLAEPRKLFDRAGDGGPLYPHGIAVARLAADGVERLFVVHHRPRGEGRRHAVEVYRLDGAAPGWEATLEGDAILSPNDLVATPAGDLYVTNEANYRGVLRQALEFFRLHSSSFVAHCRYVPGEEPVWTRTAQGPRYANGIEVAEDRLYVAATLDRALWIFEREPSDGRIGRRVEKVPVGSGVDNLTWSDAGADAGSSEGGKRFLYTAAHPDLWAFLQHARSPAKPAPAEVWRIDVAPGIPTAQRVARVFQDPGTTINAASVALLEGGVLYVGQVFGRGVLTCKEQGGTHLGAEASAAEPL